MRKLSQRARKLQRLHDPTGRCKAFSSQLLLSTLFCTSPFPPILKAWPSRHQATGILYEHLQSTGQCQAATCNCASFDVCGICMTVGHHCPQAVWSSAMPQLNAEIWTVRLRRHGLLSGEIFNPSGPIGRVSRASL